MKKVVNIRIEVETTHPAKDEWYKISHFIDDEIILAIDAVRDFEHKKYLKNCSGKTPTGATTYVVSIKYDK
ncbi:MAG: hypothetical protein LBV74_01220 [Tannerella sp.]|jgi:DNA-directed RNA polymerase subunit L|nr:hypothetical protein [Tannerella sp.]